MPRIGTWLEELECWVGTFSLEALVSQLPAEWVGEILIELGRASKRRRALPADVVVWLLIAMGLFRSLSIRNVLARLALMKRRWVGWKRLPTSSAVVKARDRLGVKPLRVLFARLCLHLALRFQPLQIWKGLKVVGIDGSTLKVQDTPENRKHFGAPKSGRGRSAFPLVRLVSLVAVSTHLLWGVAIGPYSVGEVPQAMTLLPLLGEGCLVLLDRGFLSYWLLWNILNQKSHFLIRAKKNLRFKHLRKLGPGDWLVRITVPAYLRKAHPELPETLTLRLISYRIPGFRPARLLTSLLDGATFPASELITEYHDRWEVETSYDEIKTHQLAKTQPLLRSKEPERVEQELYGLLIGYTLVRGLMAEAAQHAGLSPLSLSFVDTLERIREWLMLMAWAPTIQLMDLYRQLLQQIAACRLPARRHRKYPRAVKVKMSNYPLKRGRRHA